jgi:hypothetical protein
MQQIDKLLDSQQKKEPDWALFIFVDLDKRQILPSSLTRGELSSPTVAAATTTISTAAVATASAATATTTITAAAVAAATTATTITAATVAAATAGTVSTAATTLTATTTSTIAFRFGDIDCTAFKFSTVQSRDRRCCCTFVCHFNETETFTSSRVCIGHDASRAHFAVGFKHRLK